MKIALVTLDTVRYDSFARHFGWLPGQRFTNTWAPSHGTPLVHGAVFTGKYPSETGITGSHPTLSDDPILTEQLHDIGYDTTIWSANPYISPTFGYDRGVNNIHGTVKMERERTDTADWRTILEIDGRLSRYTAAAKSILQSDAPATSIKQGIGLIARGHGIGTPVDNGGQEFRQWVRNYSTAGTADEFLFVNLMDAHSPYQRLPNEWTNGMNVEDIPWDPNFEDWLTPPADPDATRAAYDAGVEYLATIYRDVFSKLREEFDVVITMADHGEHLGERGRWGHSAGLDPVLTHVPLVVSGSGWDSSTRCREPTSLIDVHATVLELAGIEAPSRGTSLHTPGGEYRTEYLGLANTDAIDELPPNRQRITRRTYDTTLLGAITSDGYGFEDFTGWNGADAARDVIEDVEISMQTEEAEEIDQMTKQKLEDLGYM